MSAYSERLQILVSPDQRRRLESEARLKGTSISALTREAIDVRLPRFSREERIRAAREISKLRAHLGGADVDRLIDESRLEELLDEMPEVRR